LLGSGRILDAGELTDIRKMRRWCAVVLTAGFESVGRIRRRELGELANVVVVRDETVG
jgi:hypothetical protein